MHEEESNEQWQVVQGCQGTQGIHGHTISNCACPWFFLFRECVAEIARAPQGGWI